MRERKAAVNVYDTLRSIHLDWTNFVLKGFQNCFKKCVPSHNPAENAVVYGLGKWCFNAPTEMHLKTENKTWSMDIDSVM